MGRGSPIYWVCVCDGFGSPIWFDGFWFGVMGLLGFGSARLVCWWVQIRVAGVVGFGCSLCCEFFFFFFLILILVVGVDGGGCGFG